MMLLGKYFTSKSINKTEVAQKTGLLTSRLSDLLRKETTALKAEEVNLITFAIDLNPEEILHKIYGHLKIKKAI